MFTSSKECKEKNIMTKDKICPRHIVIKYKDKPFNYRKINDIMKNLKNEFFDRDMLEFEQKNNLQDFIKDKVLLGDYLDILKKYIIVEFVQINDNLGKICNNCSKSIENHIEKEEGTIICENCNCVNNFPTILPITKEFIPNLIPDIINIHNVVISKFLVSSYCVEDVVYEKLDDYFKINFNTLHREKISLLDNDKTGRKGNTTRNIMKEALKKVNCKDYLENINEILKVYWGWDIPDIDEDKLDKIREYDISLYNYWNNNKKKYKRNAFLSNQFRLYAELYTIDIKCHIDFFDLQENKDSLRLHREVWSDFCTENKIENKIL